MRICVFVRPVHDPAFSLEPASSREAAGLDGYRPVPNPLDELALELALGLKEKGRIRERPRVCSVGGEASRTVLRELLACGELEPVWLQEPAWEPDGSVVARRIQEYVQAHPLDLGLFGTRDVETGAGQVGHMFSALTGIPYVDSVVDVLWDGAREIQVTRVVKRDRERLRMRLPACLGILRGEPLRYPTLWGKVRAGKARILPGPASRPAVAPLLVRKRFTPAKPRTGSSMGAYAQASGAEKIRQALGFKGRGAQDRKGSGLIEGAPEETVHRILEIWRQENVVDVEDPA